EKKAACEEAQRLEHVVLGTPCGLLDQMTMMHAHEGKCVLIDFSAKTTTTMSIPPDWTFKLVDSGIHRTLNSNDYRTTSTDDTKRRHVESENRRVEEAINANSEGLGKLLNETHESLKSIAVSTPEIDALVASLQSKEGVLGARMMGGGFGGMILVLVENESVLPGNDIMVASRPGFVEEFF
ncbi:MAG: hypothetical protein VXW36_04655, partial [Candidatus Thermoplasmatota archaeon]|nr:hypothetical protein [Candidatus Thermoplasmatota archaeon]